MGVHAHTRACAYTCAASISHSAVSKIKSCGFFGNEDPVTGAPRIHFHSILFCSNMLLFFFYSTNIYQVLTKCQMLCLELRTQTNVTLPLWCSHRVGQSTSNLIIIKQMENIKYKMLQREAHDAVRRPIYQKINLQKTNLPKVNFPNHWFAEFPNRQLSES